MQDALEFYNARIRDDAFFKVVTEKLSSLQVIMLVDCFISSAPLGGRLHITCHPFVCLSHACRLLNMPTHHCAYVMFNWRQPAAATASSQQQACCVSLCTLSGRASMVLTIYQANTRVIDEVNRVINVTSYY